MGVERVDYYSEDEFQQALEEEQQSYGSQPQEPDVVPCFKCGGQMYQECHAPEGNICETCEKAGNRRPPMKAERIKEIKMRLTCLDYHGNSKAVLRKDITELLTALESAQSENERYKAALEKLLEIHPDMCGMCEHFDEQDDAHFCWEHLQDMEITEGREACEDNFKMTEWFVEHVGSARKTLKQESTG
ncbi:hypothetical protein LCGC14_0362270 [marine sediment metagenome]|uniref:Uncharacterized protein n=1 Tax=marine sediment metagenome TaxID=412755 RepID=A0A0F9TDK9_9ZZZZ